MSPGLKQTKNFRKNRLLRFTAQNMFPGNFNCLAMTNIRGADKVFQVSGNFGLRRLILTLSCICNSYSHFGAI